MSAARRTLFQSPGPMLWFYLCFSWMPKPTQRDKHPSTVTPRENIWSIRSMQRTYKVNTERRGIQPVDRCVPACLSLKLDTSWNPETYFNLPLEIYILQTHIVFTPHYHTLCWLLQLKCAHKNNMKKKKRKPCNSTVSFYCNKDYSPLKEQTAAFKCTSSVGWLNFNELENKL